MVVSLSHNRLLEILFCIRKGTVTEGGCSRKVLGSKAMYCEIEYLSNENILVTSINFQIELMNST